VAASIGIAIPGLLVEMLSPRVDGKPPEALVFSAPNGGYLRKPKLADPLRLDEAVKVLGRR
jgi:hypothetical protein